MINETLCTATSFIIISVILIFVETYFLFHVGEQLNNPVLIWMLSLNFTHTNITLNTLLRHFKLNFTNIFTFYLCLHCIVLNF